MLDVSQTISYRVILIFVGERSVINISPAIEGDGHLAAAVIKDIIEDNRVGGQVEVVVLVAHILVWLAACENNGCA